MAKKKKEEIKIILPEEEKKVEEIKDTRPAQPTKEDNINMITDIINAMLDAAVAEALCTVNGKTEDAVKQQGTRDKGARLVAQILMASIEEPK